MNRTIFISTVLTICGLLASVDSSAQQNERARQIHSQVKIESFDWYSTGEAAEPPANKNYYRRGLPEGESANFPTENSSRRKEPEKVIYRIRIRNLSDREITSVVWRYEFVNPLTEELTASLEFESRAQIKPHRRKTLYGESFSPPAQVVDAKLFLLNKKQPFLESAIVKAVIFKESAKKNKN